MVFLGGYMEDVVKEVKPTTEILKRPKCAIKNCPNDAFIEFVGKWVCGDCAMKKDAELKRRVWDEE